MRKAGLRYSLNLVGVAVLAFLLAMDGGKALLQWAISAAQTGLAITPQQNLWLLSLVSLLFSVLCLLLPVALLQKGRLPEEPKPPLFAKRLDTRAFFPWFALFLGFIILAGLIAAVLNGLFSKLLPGYAAPEIFTVPSDPVAAFFMMLIICVVPAIFEEILFRGYIQKRLLPHSQGFAIVVTSVLFAVLHARPADLPSIFLFSLFLGCVAQRFDTLAAPMILHFINNLTGFVTKWASDALPPTGVLGIIGLIYALYIVGGIYGYLRLARPGALDCFAQPEPLTAKTVFDKVKTAPVLLAAVALSLVRVFAVGFFL